MKRSNAKRGSRAAKDLLPLPLAEGKGRSVFKQPLAIASWVAETVPLAIRFLRELDRPQLCEALNERRTSNAEL